MGHEYRPSPADPSAGFTRRSLLVWGGAAAAGALAAGMSQGAPPGASASDRVVPTGAPLAVDGRGVELYMKLHAATADVEVPWYYTGRIYAVRERQPPVHLFNLEGTEIYWVRRRSTFEWQTFSSTLTFYRDARSGEYLESFVNPLTAKTLAVRPNVLRSKRPAMFSPEGTAGQPWFVESHQNGDDVWLVTSRQSLTAPQPWSETQTIFAKASELVDPGRPRPAAMFSSSYLAPYLAWMEMGEAPGHLMWHSSGRKLASIEEMPSAYRERAKRLQPGHFDTPSGA